MTLVFATGNRHKLEEARKALPESIVLNTPADLGCFEEIPETSDTIPGNAIQKAMYIWDRYHADCFADDTGLEVDALGGAPGVHSARYATAGHDFDANITKLLANMEGVPPERRTARFRCVVALVLGGELHTFEGLCEGSIITERTGVKGFGYDCIFRPEGMDCTMAEMDIDLKNGISHRGKVLRKLKAFLEQNAL